MITPLEIENKKFSKQMMNGYSVEEVDDFLDELTACYEKIYKDSNESKDKIRELEGKLEHYKPPNFIVLCKNLAIVSIFFSILSIVFLYCNVNLNKL